MKWLALTGWVLAALLWYGGRQVAHQADSYADLAGSIEFKRSICQASLADAETALAQCSCHVDARREE